MGYSEVLAEVKKNNSRWNMPFAFEVEGVSALFTDVVTKATGEYYSYPVMTPEAAKGIAKSIYWKPTFKIVIDAIRVMNPIQRENTGQLLPKFDKWAGDLFNFNFLRNVKYQVLCHIEWNENHEGLIQDRQPKKHMMMMRKAIERGGRLPAFLGKSMCAAEISPCEFGEGVGAFDNTGEIEFGTMFYGFTYPDEGYDEDTRTYMYKHMYRPIMQNGIIEVPRVTDKSKVMSTRMHKVKPKKFGPHNVVTVDETAREMKVEVEE